VRPPLARIVLAGYLGCGNMGDDAVMLGITDRLGSHHEYVVLSGDPDVSFREYGFHGVQRKSPKAVDSIISQCDAVIFPGGSIFQDVTSAKSTIYYASIAKTAKKHNKKLLFLNQGVGPLNSWIGKRQALSAFSIADLVVVRDPQSAVVLRDLGLQKKVHVGADSALLIHEPPREEGEGTYSIGSMKSIAIAPRPVHKKGVDEVALFGETCRLLFQAGFAPTLFEMDSVEDGPLLEAISKQQGGRIPQIKKLGSPRMVQARLARMESVIAMRLHAGILASSVGVPPLMVSYDPKVNAFAKMLDVGPALPVESLTPQRLFEAFQAHHKALEQKRTVVLRKREELAKEAMIAIDLANEILR
jgi:polysaccharide pyruvyl transferase CsaB